VSCQDWAALYRSSPEAALGPEEELERYRRDDQHAEHAAMAAALRQRSVAGRAAAQERFTLADPLADP
jgi:hypothetical protein